MQYFPSFHDLFVTDQTNQTGERDRLGNTEGQKKVLLIWNCHFQRTRQKKNLAPREFLASCLSPLICKGRVLSLQLLLWRDSRQRQNSLLSATLTQEDRSLQSQTRSNERWKRWRRKRWRRKRGGKKTWRKRKKNEERGKRRRGKIGGERG